MKQALEKYIINKVSVLDRAGRVQRLLKTVLVLKKHSIDC